MSLEECVLRRAWYSLCCAAALFSFAMGAHASGTPVCTEIVNEATATYTIGDTEFTETSNSSSTTVAQLIDVSVVWQDATNVTVRPGESFRVLTFLVTNTGNGADSFDLSVVNTLAGDDFDPAFDDLYLDDGDGNFDTNDDVLYVSGSGDPVLAPDESVLVFVRNSIPGDAVSEDLSDSRLEAASNTGSGDPGTSFPHPECDTDIVVGASGGGGGDIGTYVVSAIALSFVKSQSILDPFGGGEPVPGAVITYTLTVTATGSGTAESVTVTDPIPANTTYNGGTLTLNGGGLSDPADADAGDVGATAPGAVTVLLGDLTEDSPSQTVTFAVTID